MKNAKDELMKVFAALPQKDQQAIRECWENLSHGQPEIEVLSKDVLHKRGVRWAATNGAEYYFREELFSDSEPIPKSILEGAIAHELAHSFYAVEERNASLKR